MAHEVGGLRLSRDSLTAYFHASGRADSEGFSDLYTATRASPTAPFGNIYRILGSGIDTKFDEQDPTVSGNGLVLIFSREDPADPQAFLEFATRDTTQTIFRNVGMALDVSENYAISPFVRQDGGRLYFAAVLPPLGADFDLVVSSWDGSSFGAAKSLAELNTQSVESSPVVAPDDLSIYWASNRTDRPDGAGGDFDIWMATRSSESEPFARLRFLTELNTSHAEKPTFVTPDGCELYFTSDRSGADAPYLATRGP
jgi:hypothetical protein